MDFDFTEEQQAIAKVANDFVRKELLPAHAFRDQKKEFPEDICGR